MLTCPPNRFAPNRLVLEGRFSQDVVNGLRDKGHEVDVTGPWGITNGFAPIIVDMDTGVYQGGADPRRETVMLGW